MKHLDNISALVQTLLKSKTIHAMVVESPAGFGKTSVVSKVLGDLGVEFVNLGAYVSPMELFSGLGRNKDKTILIDDSSGIFSNPVSMSVLKAATWESAAFGGERVIVWRTSSDRVSQSSFAFQGKIILLTNSVPVGKEAEAFLSRTLFLNIRFDENEIRALLIEAANDKSHFPSTEIALKVANFLSGRRSAEKINLRTLRMGYELAEIHPDNWENLLTPLLPRSPQDLVEDLVKNGGSVESQARQFTRCTGLSRRTFFNYRKHLQA